MSANGWTVTTRIYDGLHVLHRPELPLADHAQRLNESLRGAERAVRTDLGYAIKLLEKPL